MRKTGEKRGRGKKVVVKKGGVWGSLLVMGGERKAVSLGVGVSKGPGVCCALRVRVCCVLCEDGACLHIFIRISSRG